MKKAFVLFILLATVVSLLVHSVAVSAQDSIEIDPTAPTAVYGTPVIDGRKDALYSDDAKITADYGNKNTNTFSAYYANDSSYFYVFIEVTQTSALAEADIARIYADLVNTDENARHMQAENSYQQRYFPVASSEYNGGQFEFNPYKFSTGRTRGADKIASYVMFGDYSFDVGEKSYTLECRIPLTDSLKGKVAAKEEISIGIGYEVRYNNGSKMGYFNLEKYESADFWTAIWADYTLCCDVKLSSVDDIETATTTSDTTDSAAISSTTTASTTSTADGNQNKDNNPALREQMQTEIFKAYDADILALQEFTAHTSRRIMPALLATAGYTEVKSPTNDTPLFYRADRVEVLHSGNLMFKSKYNNENSKSVTWAIFRMKESGKIFIAMSTHFCYFSGSEGEEGRIDNARDVLDLIAKIYADYPEYDGAPVIAGGDLNCTTTSAPMNIFRDAGMKSAWESAEQKNDNSGHHAYPEYNAAYGLYITWSLPVGSYASSIDQAWTSGKGISVKTFAGLTDFYTNLASDHCPQLVDFNIN